MKRVAVRVGSVVGVWLLLGPAVRDAAAVDLTGTWEGSKAALCRGLVTETVPDSEGADIVVKISPTTSGLTVCIDLDRTDLAAALNGAHPYHSTLFVKAATSRTAYGILTQEGTVIHSGDLWGAVGSFSSAFNQGTKVLRLKGTLTSGDETAAMTCKFKHLTRTDTDDPGTACP
jgi:hypothetical protein